MKMTIEVNAETLFLCRHLNEKMLCEEDVWCGAFRSIAVLRLDKKGFKGVVSRKSLFVENFSLKCQKKSSFK